jgi:hypothetical protein
MATELAALNVRITGDTADIQADLAKTEAGLTRVGSKAATATKSTKGFTGGLSKLGNVSGQTRAKIQNTSFQLSDIAVQLQGGTKASTAFAQQLPQLLGGFGALGAVLGVVAGIGIPAVALAFSSLGKSSETLEESLDRIGSAMDRLEGPAEILGMTVDELADKFGDASWRAMQLAAAQLHLNFGKTAGDMNETVGNLNKLISGYEDVTRAGSELTGIAKTAVEDIADEFGIAESKVLNFVAALSAIKNAKTFQEQQVALSNFILFLEKSEIPLANITGELGAGLSAMIKISNEADAARKRFEDMKDAVNGVAETLIEIEELGTRAPGTSMRPRSRPDNLVDPNKPTGVGKTDPLPGELERLQKSLMSKEELQIASFNRQQETLKNALNQELLTRQEYNLLMEDAETQHSERMAGIAVFKHGDTLQQTQAFMGSMASALSSGNEKMMKAARVFGAAEALINAFRAYNQVIADPTLPFFAKIPAALSVLGAGIGMVNSIKGVSGGGGGAGAASAASGAVGQASRPMEARISGLDPNSLFTGESITSLFDALQDEAGDRGLSVSFG